nr:hypothetical protein [uncultured Cohaesibacter sp.]
MSQAERIIMKFGGQTNLGRAIERGQSTVQRWKVSGFIPAKYHEEIWSAGQKLEEPLIPEDFLAFDPNVSVDTAE